MGTDSGSPYTPADDENTIFRTPAEAMASRSVQPPTTFVL